MTTHALALVVPVEHKMIADAVAVILGHAPFGAESYTIALSADGQKPATHYGCHIAATDQFISMMQAAISQQGLPAVNWSAAGLTDADVLSMCAALQMRLAPLDEYSTNFTTALQLFGLEKVTP